MPFAPIDGPRRLYYEEHGDPTADPLLCVQGLGTDHVAWALQLRDFAAHHRTIVFDNRDVGQSDLVGAEYDLDACAHDTLALADHLELDTFHLLGMSMGGAISQHLALLAPERMRTLTLAVTWAGSGRGGRTRGRLWGIEAERLSREEFLDLLLFHVVSEEFQEDETRLAWLRDAMLANPHPQPPEAFGRQARASRSHDLRGELSAVDVPAHVIVAEHDLMIPPWKQLELASELGPDTRVTTVARGSHALNIARFQEFNAAVLDGIAALQAG